MTTKPLRAAILAKRETIPASDPRHKLLSNSDQLLMTKDGPMPWKGQEFYVPKLLKVNADALAYREAKGA